MADAPATRARVFVYGSLKQGEINHDVMSRANGTFLTAATVRREDLTFVDFGHYPGVVQHADKGGQSTEIHGEIYEVPAEGLGILDVLEGHPSYYCRNKFSISADDGSAYRAWMYVLPPGEGYEEAPLVSGGNWSKA